MTEESLEKKLETQALRLMGVFAEAIKSGNEGNPAQFVGIMEDGGINLYSALWGSEEEKSVIVRRVGEAMRSHGVVGYALISEVWYLQLEPGEKLAGQPSDYPDRRREAISCYLEFGETKLQFHQDVTRDPLDIGPVIREKLGGSFQGRMTGLLN